MARFVANTIALLKTGMTPSLALPPTDHDGGDCVGRHCSGSFLVVKVCCFGHGHTRANTDILHGRIAPRITSKSSKNQNGRKHTCRGTRVRVCRLDGAEADLSATFTDRRPVEPPPVLQFWVDDQDLAK